MRTMVEFGHTKIEDRIGKNGWFAEEGDVVEVVKGRKFPIGMKFVVAENKLHYRVYNGSIIGQHNLYSRSNEYLMFYDMTDRGIKEQYINADNVVIIAQDEDRKNPEYKNVHSVEVYA